MSAPEPVSTKAQISSPIPLYHQVSRILRQRIVDGTYPIGSRLAAEPELAAEFGVARATIRQAVAELVEAGLLSREQGRATFVLQVDRRRFGVTFRGDLDELIAIADPRQLDAQDVTLEEHAQPPPNVARVLGIGPEGCTVIRRTLVSGTIRIAYHVNFVPSRYAPLLKPKELRRTGVLAILARAGVRPTRAQQSVTARSSEATESAQLGLALGTAVLLSERYTFGSDGEPLDCNRAWHPGELYAFAVDFERNEVAE